MDASTLTRSGLPLPRRLLAALSDERLALEAERGNVVAFEVIYERHHRGLLSFCRHMLRSQEDGEDALQQTFASAFRALPGSTQPIVLKPWLYTIARNRCLTMLRARREYPSDESEMGGSTAGLSEQVEQREELRELLSSVEDLPEPQRAALVLSEIGDLGHSEIAQVLGCETRQVKALVYQARSALIQDRRAREIPCEEIREQLATASAGDLRRGHVRRHVRNCEGCAEFRDDVRRQRGLLALALPVIPSLGLKESALAAAGIGGGGAAGGGGLIAAFGASGAAKVAAVAIATGGAAGGVAAADPDLVARAQSAVEHIADAGSSPPNGARSGVFDPDEREGASIWEGAERTARRHTAREKRARPGAFAPDAPSGADESQGRGPVESGVEHGQGYGNGPAKEGPESRGGTRRQGPRGATGQGKSNGTSPQGGRGRGRGRGPGTPRLDTSGADKPRVLTRPRDRVEKPADELLERGKSGTKGLERKARPRPPR